MRICFKKILPLKREDFFMLRGVLNCFIFSSFFKLNQRQYLHGTTDYQMTTILSGSCVVLGAIRWFWKNVCTRKFK
jgi:hypothetical protein